MAKSILIFDEHFAYPGWRDPEFKAFQEWVALTGQTYKYLAYSLFTRQLVVRVG